MIQSQGIPWQAIDSFKQSHFFLLIYFLLTFYASKCIQNDLVIVVEERVQIGSHLYAVSIGEIDDRSKGLLRKVSCLILFDLCQKHIKSRKSLEHNYSLEKPSQNSLLHNLVN